MGVGFGVGAGADHGCVGLDVGDPIVRRRLVQKMEFFLEDVAPPRAPSDAELRALAAHPFRGNVRELRAVVERALATGRVELAGRPPTPSPLSIPAPTATPLATPPSAPSAPARPSRPSPASAP